MATQQTSKSADVATVDGKSLLDQLLGKEGFNPPDQGKKIAIEKAVRTLAEQALSESAVISDDVVSTIRGIIASIDHQLNAQVNEILHNEKFQKLEGAWRGLHYFVSNTETSSQLKIKVFNISKPELSKTLGRYAGSSWDQSPFFKKIYSAEYGTLGGEPFAALVGDYHFDHSPQDVALLGQMAQIAAAAHAPFIAGASSTLLGQQSWHGLGNIKDVKKVFTTPDYAGWNSLRNSEDSRYLGLAMPRFLARLPYGAKTTPVEEFAFEEDTDGTDHDKYVWANSAYAMARNIAQAYSVFGWCTAIRGVENGGLVEGLPVHTFKTSDGGVDAKIPTEISIDFRRENELSDSGLLPLLYEKNTDQAAFIGGQSVQKPAEYNNSAATDSAKLSARLPYLMATSRFAHYLNAMTVRKIGSFKEGSDLERWLSDWIKDYVLEDPQNHNEEMRARKPLAAASIEIKPIEGSPGAYAAKFKLRPHYQLEQVNIELSLVSKVQKQG